MYIFRRLGLNQSKLDIMIALKKMDGQNFLDITIPIWQYTVCGSFSNGIENDSS